MSLSKASDIDPKQSMQHELVAFSSKDLENMSYHTLSLMTKTKSIITDNLVPLGKILSKFNQCKNQSHVLLQPAIKIQFYIVMPSDQFAKLN